MLATTPPLVSLRPPTASVPRTRATAGSQGPRAVALAAPAKTPSALQTVGPLSPWKWLAEAVLSGRPAVLPGDLPPYSRLDATSKRAAIQRGAGREIAQPLTAGSATEKAIEDPVNFVVTGSLEQLAGALAMAGWRVADELSAASDTRMALSVLFGFGNDATAPVSPQFLNGKPAVVAFNKNSEHARGRDHLRVFALPPDAKTGAARWAIACTRDTGAWLHVPHPSLKSVIPKVVLGHDTDPHIDSERDMIMVDLLGTGAVSHWAAVAGRRPAGMDQPGPDGVKIANRFHSDGRVYEVTLGKR
jgi:hypothetical protein